MSDWYILDENKKPVLSDLIAANHWMNDVNQRVGYTELSEDLNVSTVFLGLDHKMTGSPGQPVLFETMIFGGEHNEYCWRYYTWDEAEEGHKRVVKCLQNGADPNDNRNEI